MSVCLLETFPCQRLCPGQVFYEDQTEWIDYLMEFPNVNAIWMAKSRAKSLLVSLLKKPYIYIYTYTYIYIQIYIFLSTWTKSGASETALGSTAISCLAVAKLPRSVGNSRTWNEIVG